MADIANDIQQLKALQSDLRSMESLPRKIKDLEKNIEERKEHIPSLYPLNDQSQSEIAELEEEIKEEATKRWQNTTSGKITNVFVFLMIVPPIIAIIASFFLGHIFRTILISVGWALINLIIIAVLPYDMEKITREVKFEYKEKFAEIEARKKSNELDRKNRIATALSNDPELKRYYQELEQCKTSLDLCKANIYNNNILSGRDKNLDTVSYVLDQLISKRADSIKEALQRYDDKRARDSQFAFDQWQRAFDREVARQEAEKREAEARRERELQRIRQEKIDRENKELRDKISNSLDDIEDIKRSLNR